MVNKTCGRCLPISAGYANDGELSTRKSIVNTGCESNKKMVDILQSLPHAPIIAFLYVFLYIGYQMKLHVRKIPWYASWRGLLWKKAEPVFFKTRFGIHTFGMHYPIDVVILDKTDSIRKIQENLAPNKIFLWNPLFNTVVELPQGTVRKNKLTLGKKLHLQTF